MTKVDRVHYCQSWTHINPLDPNPADIAASAAKVVGYSYAFPTVFACGISLICP